MMASQRLRWIFAKQRMVVVREPSELDETLLQRDLGNGDSGGVTVPQSRMNRGKPLVTQEGDGSDTDDVGEGAMQGSSGHVERRADLGDMDGTRAGRRQVVLDVAN